MKTGERITLSGLVLISTMTLCYEVIQTRIFSYSLHPVIAYTAIAIAMLGFGLGATVLSLRPAPVREGLNAWLSWACSALALCVVAVNGWFAHTSQNVITVGNPEISWGWSAAVLLPCIVPYFLSGLVTAAILEANVSRIGRTYFLNLVGSALGCVAAILMLRPLGAEVIVGISAASAALAALLFGIPERGWHRVAALAALALALAATLFAPRIFTFQPDTNEAVMLMQRMDRAEGLPGPESEFTQWDPLGRIDVVKHGPPYIRVPEAVRYRSVTIDGGAVTLLVEDPGMDQWGEGLYEKSIYSAPHRIRPGGDVLVIGVGGGTDVNTALHHDARSVTGVEISLSTLRAITGPYADFAGFTKDPRLDLIHGDGRSFAKSTKRRFDIIQLSGVDTITVRSSGSMVLAEDYLYTTDAFQDFLGILKPGGVLSVMRFGEEAMSLAAIAAGALRQLGIEHPEKHIVALRQKRICGVLVKNEPFTREQESKLLSMEKRTAGAPVIIPHYDHYGLRLGAPIQLLFPPGRAPEQEVTQFFSAMVEGREQDELTVKDRPFIVPTDERPYYMMGYWMSVVHRKTPDNPLPRLFFVTSIITSVAALLMMLLPALAFRRLHGTGARAVSYTLVYFLLLGGCFMLFEVNLIHKMIIFVGTPGAAVSVVLASILVSSGIGSFTSGRMRWPVHARLGVALGGLVLLGLAFIFGVDRLLEPLYALPYWARNVAACAVLSPVGFFMGWFFPLGMRVVGSSSRSLVPWAIAVNGFASVIGSLVTFPLGMLLGSSGVSLVGLGGYVLAVIVMAPMAIQVTRRDR